MSEQPPGSGDFKPYTAAPWPVSNPLTSSAPFGDTGVTSDFETLSKLRHALRTPLNQIIGYTEMLLESVEEKSSAALFRDLCARAEVPVQHYAHRTDLPCGSTIGPIASTLLGIRTVDVGNPMLSMHSIRELGGARDPAMMTNVLTAFYGCADPGSP